MPRSRRPHPGTASVVTLAVLLLAACGGGASSASPTRRATVGTGSAEAPRAQVLAYTHCMRDHGVDLPDPTFDHDGRPRFGTDRPGHRAEVRGDRSFDTARAACASTWPASTGRYERSPAELARTRTALLAFAACMRGQAVNFPDPTFDDDGRPVLGTAPGSGAGGAPHDAAFTAAVHTCRDRLGDRWAMGGTVRP
jgi:hypothetical protein